MRKVNLLVVHCSATPAAMDLGVREIRQWHLARGWSDIGYHYVIRRNGGLEPGRPLQRAGAHAKGHNAHSIGICLAGGTDAAGNPENNFTNAQFAALRQLLEKLLQDYPASRICGHRDLSNVRKACPCFDVRTWWAQNTPDSDNTSGNASGTVSGAPARPVENDWNTLLDEIAARHGLPRKLVAAMVAIESGGNPWAIRYEPGFYSRYLADKDMPRHGASQNTEDHARAMSWGLMQILGEVARELGCELPFLSQLCDPVTGLDWSCRYLARLREKLTTQYGATCWECVCAAYNGGPGVVTGADSHNNAAYANKVREALGGRWPQ